MDAPSPINPIRSRISNACDGCKSRKVKCDGNLPCTYCTRRQRPHLCLYSPQKRRRISQKAATASPAGQASNRLGSRPRRQGGSSNNGTPSRPNVSSNPPLEIASTPRGAEDAPEEETEVPREARLHTDSQGKLIFIGDCAPLSFFQSVRQLVTNRIGLNAFAPESSRFSVLVNAPSHPTDRRWGYLAGPDGPSVAAADVEPAVAAYLATVSGLVDFFDDDEQLRREIMQWSRTRHKDHNAMYVLYYLVLSIGVHVRNPGLSQAYFEYAQTQALSKLSGEFGVEMIQAFALITIYLLCTCQINGAFLFFGIAVRAAYSIGVHRTEVNARFGTRGHKQRDRLWKSLRVVDLYLSSSLGRPPGTSDGDYTVPYRETDENHVEAFDLLNASVQIFLIIDTIVSDIYSKRTISLQLTEGISLRLREWSGAWLDRLKDATVPGPPNSKPKVVGATQVLATYYYAVMLVTRPFLMYELCRRLESAGQAQNGRHLPSGRSRLADACIDAASLIVEMVRDQIDQGTLDGDVPLIVSWLFAASLVFGLGLLGGFGRLLEKQLRTSIRALDHFAQSDAHAHQYSLIAQSLLQCAIEHLERSEGEERRRRTETSSRLFGLGPGTAVKTTEAARVRGSSSPTATTPADALTRRRDSYSAMSQEEPYQDLTPGLQATGSSFLGFTESLLQTPDAGYLNTYTNFGGAETDNVSALNLFPLLDGGGGIDLAHYFEPGNA